MAIGCENHIKFISTICTNRCSSVVVMNGLVSWMTRVWIPNRNKRKRQTHSGAPHKFHWLPECFPWGGGGGSVEPDDSTPPVPKFRSFCNVPHLTHSLHILSYDNFFALLRATSPDTALYCSPLQIPLSSPFINAISLAPCDLFLAFYFHTS
jgi:hypothetical protein